MSAILPSAARLGGAVTGGSSSMIKLSHEDRKATQTEFQRWERGTQKLVSGDVHYARLAALKGGVKLEARGLKRHGKSCTMVVRQMFNLPVGTSRDVLIERLEKEMEELLNANRTSVPTSTSVR